MTRKQELIDDIKASALENVLIEGLLERAQSYSDELTPEEEANFEAFLTELEEVELMSAKTLEAAADTLEAYDEAALEAEETAVNEDVATLYQGMLDINAALAEKPAAE